jgi:acetyltransferase
MRKHLKKLFQPQSIAVIGASDKKESVGYVVLRNLLDGQYKGKVIPVNLRHRKVQGLVSYYRIADLDTPPDLAIITTPAYAVLQVVRECGEAGVGGLAILSAGFSELDEEGKHRLERIKKISREYNMRVLGPNCLGFINPHLSINASFSPRMANRGNIAFLSQSGALGIATLDWAVEQNVGFSYFVSVGNMADIAFADLIDFLGSDAHTSCILIYMESLKEPRRFMSAARSFSRYKPIIVLKAGRSMEGQRAAFSHAGVLVGNDAGYTAAFRRSGIIRVDTMAQLFNCAQSLAMQPRPAGPNLAILTNAAGPSVLATDYLISNGGRLAPLSDQTFSELNERLPVHWSHSNPVNVHAGVEPEAFESALKQLLKDPKVDGVLALLTYQAMTDPVAIAQAVVRANKHSRKTLLASWIGEGSVQKARAILEEGKVPNYRFPESAVDVFLKMYHYNRNLKLLSETPAEEPEEFKPKRRKARELLKAVMDSGRYQMTEVEAKDMLACYGLPVTQYKLVDSEEEAVAQAAALGYPVALKLATPDVYHKSDIGGVQLNLHNEASVRQAYQQMHKSFQKHAPDASIIGVIVERMFHQPFELLIGARKDPLLGPIIAFGKGGVDVEIYKDTQLGIPPMNMALAQQLIERTRIFPLLQGYRNREGVNLRQLSFILCKFAYLLMDFPEIKEIDINPLSMGKKGAAVLDAHIVLDERGSQKPYHHLIISPYPGRYRKQVTARNGTTVLLRPIRPEDEQMELEMVNRTSKESLYFRFFGYVPKMTHELMIRFTQIDYDREMAIVALVEKEGAEQMIGVVRIIADPWGEAAEYAILIDDEWQGQRLGSQMTDFIIEIARDMGLSRIYATLLSSNKGMLALFKSKGFEVKREDFETYRVDLKLT